MRLDDENYAGPRSLKAGGRLRPLALLLVLLASLLGYRAAHAQAWPPATGNGVVVDNTGRLDPGSVSSAAQELTALGVKPLAVLTQNSLGFANSEALARAAAEHYGLGSNGGSTLDPNLFLVAVTLNPQQSTILYGDNLKGAMEQAGKNGTVADDLRTNYLNPNLAGGNFAEAFTSSFHQAASQIQLFRNPPTATPPSPPVVTNIDTKGLGNALLWVFVGVVVLVALVIFLPGLYRRRQRDQATAARRRALEAQLLQARNTAADMITNLDLPADPSEQIQYKFVALALANQRPQQLEEITTRYHQAYDRVSQALATFNSLNQGRFTSEEEMNRALAEYQQVQMAVQEANRFLQQLDEMGKSLQEQAAGAPGEIDAAKKAMAAATTEIARLAAAAPDLYSPKPDRVLQGANQSLARATQAMAANPPRALVAYDAAVDARAQAERVLASVRALHQAYEALSKQRVDLAEARARGFKLSQVDAPVERALSLLSEAAQHLEAGRAQEFNRALEQAAAETGQAGQLLSSAIALQDTNTKALADLKAKGEELKARIAEGARAFDKVDEYAESSWQDIRGNGTEAQVAADHAFNLWQEATAGNALSPESTQDFEAARDTIKEADDSIAKGHDLITAITDRLKNLEESKRVAQDEIAAAERDITAGRSYISRYNPDITPDPETVLANAEKTLDDARQEISHPKPDWIRVVNLARQANTLADRALADARSQEEAMEVRRQRLNTAAQQAAASVSRAANFAGLHRTDLDRTIFDMLQNAQTQLQTAQQMASQAQGGRLEDAALARALDQAAATYASAQKSADEAYSRAARRFGQMEALRREAHEALSRADAAIREATAFMQEHHDAISNRSAALLQQAIDAVPQWQEGLGEAALGDLTNRARSVEDQTRMAYQTAADEVEQRANRIRERQMQDAMGQLIVAGALSALANSGRRGRRGGGGFGRPWGGGGFGGGFGGGGGSSSGGFGGGGSSSGGFGGGGGSSGSFGGGGSSGGGWGGGGSSSGGW